MSPICGLREVSESIFFEGELFGDDFVEDCFFDTASTNEVAEECLLFRVLDLLSELIVFRLREGVDSLVVARVILLFLGSFVRDSDGPGVDRSGPLASGLKTHDVLTSAYSSKAVLTPGSSP